MEKIRYFLVKKYRDLFPSPYGVSFILMVKSLFIMQLMRNTRFRLLTEYYSFLLKMHDGVVLIEANKFPSPYEVLFILIKSTFINKRKITNWVSVSLWSIIHSYGAQQLATYRMQKDSMFPSPYGVSFILIQLNLKNATSEIEMFPSPYGVSFILISYL